MSEPIPDDLIELATPYALHALTDAEAADVERWIADAAPEVIAAFTEEVRAVQETLAALSAATAVEPPAELRDRLMATVAADPVRSLPTKTAPRGRVQRWRTAALAAAAAVVIGLGGVVVWTALQPEASLREQVLAASDALTEKTDIAGGTATLVFSREENAAVLTMNDVPPPQSGTVYQMWLVPEGGDPASAGTMGPDAVTPTTEAVIENIDGATTLAFTVEPGEGSTQPTGVIVAALDLST